MARVHDSINVSVSCEVVFHQLTRFEEYPRFMAGVRDVRRRDETHLHWSAEANGRSEEWDAEIIESVPPERIAWRAPGHDAVVTCRPTPWGKARVFFDMEEEPLQPAADGRHYLEATRRRLHANLENFREWVERAERGTRNEGQAEQTGPVLPA